MVYVSDSVTGFYLSYDTMVDLLMINKDFPRIGSCADDSGGSSPAAVSPDHNNADGYVRELNAGCIDPHEDKLSCDCAQRSSIPDRPTSLPFPPIPENNAKMLLRRYATFNTCPHRPLPCMTGPPVEIHIDESSSPRTCHTAAPVPMHWQKRVCEDLLRDEALGVIEQVPYGIPVSWCHRMVVTRKHEHCGPVPTQQILQKSPLNKSCKRESFPWQHMEKRDGRLERLPQRTPQRVRQAPHHVYHTIRSLAVHTWPSGLPVVWRWV